MQRSASRCAHGSGRLGRNEFQEEVLRTLEGRRDLQRGKRLALGVPELAGEEMCLGHTIADAVVILGSIDIVLGEVDR